MAITWTEVGDNRANLGTSGIVQGAKANFGASDYAPGGYPVYPSSFGLSSFSSLIPVGYSAVTAPYDFVFVYPTVAGPSASNPGFIKVYGSGGSAGAPAVEVSASSNFSGGFVVFEAYGY